MKPLLRLFLLLYFSIAARADEITVFAAASLTDSLKQIGAAFEKATGDKVSFNFAASNTLAQQIQAGAPADLFFPADEAKMDALEKAGLIMKESRRSLLGNRLVVVTLPEGPAISKASDLASGGVRRFSLADPKAVPAGIYAKAWLEKAGQWEAMQAKVVPAENVRAAMAVVESGNAEAGVVYKTDAAISKTLKVAYEVPEADAPKIVYPVALVKDTRHAEAARRFLAWVVGKESAETFKRFGFSVLE